VTTDQGGGRWDAHSFDFALVTTNYSDSAGCAHRPVMRRSGRRTPAGHRGRRPRLQHLGFPYGSQRPV